VTYSSLATPSQTIAALKRHGLVTKKSLGQHFLIDDNVVGRIFALDKLRGDETVVDVGPGIGTLTVALCERAGSVVAVERDADLLPVLAETTAQCARLSVIRADAVAVEPSALSEPYGPPVALVANLPYAVAATVVLRFFEILPTLETATVMVQAEVANRMSADPGSRDFGAYSVKLRLHARPEGRFAVPRTCFMPPPRVDSAVLRLVRHPLAEDPALLHAAARAADAAFAQRRKTIRNSLKATLAVDASNLDAMLVRAGIDGGARAEELPVERFIALGEALLEHEL
jgi:16S rRNA (adenine1518-N6/adenine1519-N6)-dimethyltransferase